MSTLIELLYQIAGATEEEVEDYGCSEDELERGDED
jgi:hypothetical protein